MTESLTEYIARAKEQNPIERKILRKIYAALKDAGKPIVTVFDGDEYTKVTTLDDCYMQVFNLDECYLSVFGGGWVRFVMGNEFDALVDYTLNLEEALKPVNDWIEKYSD